MVDNKIINDTAKTIATTSTMISEAVYNATRVAFMVKNISLAGEVIYLAIGKEAIIGQGIQLQQGDYIFFSRDGGYTPSQDRINAIASVATANLAIHEEIDLAAI